MFLLLPLAAAATPSPDAIDALTGRWRLAEPRAAVQARVDTAIDAALSPFNMLIRGLARPLVLKASSFCDGYRTRLTATSYSVACDAIGEVSATFGQPPATGATKDGRAYQLSGSYEEGAVTLTFESEAGLQRVRYGTGGAGVFLVTKSIYAERLDANVAWDMQYLKE